MARPAGEALTKITLNLPTADLEVMKATYPSGYQLKIRELVREHVEEIEWNAAEAELSIGNRHDE